MMDETHDEIVERCAAICDSYALVVQALYPEDTPLSDHDEGLVTSAEKLARRIRGLNYKEDGEDILELARREVGEILDRALLAAK